MRSYACFSRPASVTEARDGYSRPTSSFCGTENAPWLPRAVEVHLLAVANDGQDEERRLRRAANGQVEMRPR